MTRRRGPKPFTPFGRPIVGTPETIAQTLRVPTTSVAAAVAALPAWGLDFQERPVWRLADVEQALGRPEPPRVRGATWRGQPIVGTRGRRRGRQEPQSGGQEWALTVNEEV